MLRKFTIIGILWIGIISQLHAQGVNPTEAVSAEMRIKWEQGIRASQIEELSKLRNQMEGRIQADISAQKANNAKSVGNKKKKSFSSSRTTSAASTTSAPLPTLAEYNALMDLYNSTGGPTNWINKIGWSSANPSVVQSVEGWTGITVDIDGHIVSLNLYANGLYGVIPPSIGNLTYLKLLDLSGQGSGILAAYPNQIYQLINLEYLALGNENTTNVNQTFALSSQIASLSKLIVLDLSVPITGTLPSELYTLSFLERLTLGCQTRSSLSGSISSSIQNLIKLKRLYIYNCNISGGIPSEIGSLGFLEFLGIQYCLVTGSIPSSIGNLNRLTMLILSYNQLSGSIPPQLGSLTNLTSLWLNNNNLSGALPTQLGGMSSMVSLWLSTNHFSGELPVSMFTNLVNLQQLFIYSNSITGNIPHQISGLSKLVDLYAFDNQLNGQIPVEVGTLLNLSTLVLFSNNLDGEIPSSLGNLVNLTYLNLALNKLSGVVPSQLSNLPKLNRLHLYSNQLSGTLPLGNLTNTIVASKEYNIIYNRFTFTHILPAKTALGNVLEYNVQDSIDVKKVILATIGSPLTLTTTIDRNTNPPSLYQWFKWNNGVSTPLTPVPTAGGHTYTIASITQSDIGTRYYYKVTNSSASDLVLTSRMQQIVQKMCFAVTKPRVLVTKYLCAVGFTTYESRLNSCAGTSFEWDFGDGTTSLDKNPIHPYSNLGTYNVSLKYTYQCGACAGDTTIYKTVTITPNSSTPLVDSLIQVTTLKKQKILNATASTFSDSWSLPFESSDLRSKNSFTNGTQGVWRNNASYAFQAPRSQSSPINIAQDGTYTLNQFDWNSADLEIIPGWIRANSMTQYSSYSYELENRDVLGVYSAALYDYGGHLPSANGVNMRNNEMAFTSFEFLNDKPTGNWIFNNNAQPANTTYNINTAKDYTIIVEASLEELSEVQQVDITAQREVYSFLGYFFFPYANSSVTLTDVNIACRQVHPFNPKWSILVLSRLPFEGIWVGKATVKRLTVPSITPSIDNAVFHSGHSSLKINSEQSYVQPFLQLDSGKSYSINSWVSVNNPNVATPELAANLGFDILFKTSLGQVISSVSFTPTGNIIEGWQQVKGTFISPIKNPLLVIKFKPGSGGIAWYDDLRLHPEKGNMKAYVYDLKDYRLRSILDEENFASFFYYDVEGNLYLTKKETEKGIKTITENVSYQVEKP